MTTQPSPPPTTLGRLLENRVRGRAAVATAGLRVFTGLVFVLSSLPKFVLHEFELSEFVRFGLPESSLLVYAVGLLELVAGLMLIVGLGTRLAALGLASNMAGAVATAGVTVGGPFHLVLAPALLISMLVLLWAGPGAAALDRRVARHVTTTDRGAGHGRPRGGTPT